MLVTSRFRSQSDPAAARVLNARAAPDNLDSPMKKNSVLLAALTMVVFSGPTPAANATDRPNIVFILMDDLRWDALGCTGHPVAQTPHIDRIAKEGALFKNFFVTLPLCSPSRASFLTGQYAHTHGVTNNADHSVLSHQLMTFPRLLQRAGYETAYVGKWHMGADDSPRPGFDRWVSFKGQGVYHDPMLNIDGEPARATGYMSDILSEHAVRFIRAGHKKPFLLYLSHKAVHGPFTPAERHKDLYSDAKLKPPVSFNDTLDGKPALTRRVEGPRSQPPNRAVNRSAEDYGALERNQLRMMASVDEGVGRILEALEATRQLDNTMVIFTSDNGFFWSEHGLGDKRWAYEESIRDPLLIRYPKLIKAGTTLDPFVLNIDIAPTLLDLAGAEIPKSIEGRSILPLIKKPGSRWRTSFFAEYFQEKQYPRVPTWQAVRTAQWKYIHYPDLDGMDELYDLKTDPHELKNLIAEPRAQQQLSAMKAEMLRLRKVSSR